MIQNDKGSTNQKGNPYFQGFNMTRSDYKLGYEIDRDHSNNSFITKNNTFSEAVKRTNNHEEKKKVQRGNK